MHDYTIDYEEYFNRQKVWCSWANWWNSFTWNVWLSWYCPNFTYYGNGNSTARKRLESTWYHDIYYCSSYGGHEWDAKQSWWYRIVKEKCGTIEWQQSYGQYAALFTDVHRTVWITNEWAAGDSDDENLWQPVNNKFSWAVADSDNVQEIYLISIDWNSRLYFRRSLVAREWKHAHYKLQMLRLKWFDAGQKHNFDLPNNEWLYDWKIDTRACDASMWFECEWASIGGAYSEYNLPANVNDWWIDVTQWWISLISRNISVSPKDNPELWWNWWGHQVNPFFTLQIINGVYAPYYRSALWESIEEFKMALKTTFNMKHFYTE